MNEKEDYHFGRRSVLRTLGAGGGLYGLTRASGIAGATQYATVGSSTTARPNSFDTIDISSVADEVYSDVWEDVNESFSEWIHEIADSWREVVDELWGVFDYIASSASDAIDTALDSVSDLDVIEDAIRKVDFVLENSTQIIAAVGDEIKAIKEELAEEEDEDDASGSIGPVRAGVGAGNASTTRVGTGAASGTTIPNPIDGIQEKVSELEELAGEIVDFVDNLSDNLRQTFNSLWEEGVDEFIDDLQKGFESILEPAIDGLTDLALGPINRLTGIWNERVSGNEIELDGAIGHDVFDFDFDTGMKPVFVPKEFGERDAGTVDPQFGTSAGYGSTGGTPPRTTLSTGANFGAGGTGAMSGGLSPGPGRFKFDLPLPVGFLEIPKDECRGAAGTVHAMGVDIIPDWPGVEFINYTPFFGTDFVRPCVYLGASLSAGGPIRDFLDLYQSVTDHQKSWEELAAEIRSTSDEILEDIESASTLDDTRQICRDIQEFIDSLRDEVNLGAVPLFRLMDAESAVDFEDFYDEAASLEDDIDTAIHLFSNSTLQAVIDVNDILTDIENDGIPQYDTVVEATDAILEARAANELATVDESTLQRLVAGSRAIYSVVQSREGHTLFDGVPESRLERLSDQLGLIQADRGVTGLTIDLKVAEAIDETNRILSELEEELSDPAAIQGFETVRETTEIIVEANSDAELAGLEMNVLGRLVDGCRTLFARVRTNGAHDRFEDVPESDLETLEAHLDFIANSGITTVEYVESTVRGSFKRKLADLKEVDTSNLEHDVIDVGGKYSLPPSLTGCTDWICRKVNQLKRAIVRIARQAVEIGAALGSWFVDIFPIRLPNPLSWFWEKLIQIQFTASQLFVLFVVGAAVALSLLGFKLPEPALSKGAASVLLFVGYIFLTGQEVMLYQVASVMDLEQPDPILM